MKLRNVSVLSVVCLVLVATLVAVVAAQGPEPPPPDWPGGKPFPGPDVPGRLNMSRADASSVLLGQPGTSFRYVQRFGVTEEGYFEDTSHFYNPSGVGTAGNTVWIADSWGNRVVKFDSAGNFQQQIGKASFREASGTSLNYITDVAVDGGGNIWAVDEGAHHVVKYDSSGQRISELGDRWDSGSDNAHFNDPAGIAFDGAGNIYVSDTNNHRIQVFDSSGNYLATIGETGVAGSDNSHLRDPRRIAIYSNSLYIADAGNHRVQIFDISTPASPIYSATSGVTGVSGSDNSHFDYPEGVAVDASYIYIADSNNNRVQIFSRTAYAYVATIGGSRGTGDYEFKYPTDVAVDASGNIYVADSANMRVQQFNTSRAYRRTYGTTGVPYLTDDYHYNYPTGVAVAGDGSIYIVENRGKRLVKLNAAGVSQWTVGEPGVSGYDNGHFRYPNGVAVDSTGHVYVADTANNRVQIYDTDGTYYATLGTGYGTGDYQFNNSQGVAVDLTGNIYVADRYNHRIQVYNASRTYIGTIGTTGAPGSDNGHFDEPYDVAVDSACNVYVVDLNNHRVQKCVPSGSTWTCATIVGESGVPGNDFGHLEYPIGITVDGAGRIYVADGWGGRVQVFDSTGAYLTTIGGSSGNRTGQMRQADGLAMDSAGNLYIAEYLNHRIQKFAPSVPGWMQVNINGFGHPWGWISGLSEFKGHLYAGGGDQNNGQIWRYEAPAWIPTLVDGLGQTYDTSVQHLVVFQDRLYAGAGTWDSSLGTGLGGEVWRSDDGLIWNRVVDQGFGDPTNVNIWHMGVFSDTILASTSTYPNHGLEVWRSTSGDAGTWSQVVSNGFGDVNNAQISAFQAFGGHLYVSTYNWQTGGEVWRSPTGNMGTWTQVNADGFGDPNAYRVDDLAVFGEHLYASTSHRSETSGTEVWRCQVCDGSDWQQIVDNGFGNASTRGLSAMEPFDGWLYLAVGNPVTGLEVWRTANGTDWEQVGFAGLGDSNNYGTLGSLLIAFADRLYLGTYNYANGVEVWMRVPHSVYLPLVMRNH